MSLPVILLLEGLVFVILFGGLAFLRREGLSMRFALEATIITLIVSGLTVLTGLSTHPVAFLILLYLITMRVRVLVDLGNLFAKRSQFENADRIYQMVLRLWPDETSRLIVQVNQGAALIQKGNLDAAIGLLNLAIEQTNSGYLGVKYESAAYYNLGIAYQRKQMNAQAVIAFNRVLDTWPASEYARSAAIALERHHKNKIKTSKDQ